MVGRHDCLTLPSCRGSNMTKTSNSCDKFYTWVIEYIVLGIIAVLCLNTSGAHGQEGFISIDCGASASYRDSSGISWSTDDGYIPTGENLAIDTSQAQLGYEQSQISKQMSTARLFTQLRTKFCYTFAAQSSSLYLIRLRFLKGNLTSPGDTISFGITADAFSWGSLAFGDSFNFKPQTAEFYMVTGASSRSLSICLVRDQGTPFISSLELRRTPSSFYQGPLFPQAVLKLLTRWDCGASAGPPTRYPKDPYDRLWYPAPASYSFSSLSNPSARIQNQQCNNGPPVRVLQSGWTAPRGRAINLTLPSHMQSQSSSSDSITYFFGYFAELLASGNSNRALALSLNDQPLWSKTLYVSQTAHAAFNYSTAADLRVSVEATRSSSQGPILNALETFSVVYYKNGLKTLPTDVDAISALQVSLHLTDWTGDPCLPDAWDWVKCSIPDEDSISTILQIDLSNYGLSGSIPEEVSQFTALQQLLLDNNKISGEISGLTFPRSLQTLELQNNQLTGDIPESLASLPILAVLALDNNALSGDIPTGIIVKFETHQLNFSATGNPGLCLKQNSTCSGFSPPSSLGSNAGTGQTKKPSSIIGIAAGAVGGALALIALLVLLLFCRGRSRHPDHQGNKTQGSANLGTPGIRNELRQSKFFTLGEVKIITNNFEKRIGRGAHGLVFFGRLSNGEDVAVKVITDDDTNEGRAEFLNEVELLSRLHHRNLVSLVGYCDELGQQILLYALMSEGTVRDHLDGTDRKRPLAWRRRLDIAFNAARGLEYLHNSCSPSIIHRDVKTANILLTKDLLAKVADFGISKLAPDVDRTRGVTTLVRGTYGYLDPEYLNENRLTTKSDVYSFGVVLLELVTGKKPNESTITSSGQVKYLQDWVREVYRTGDIHQIMDPRLEEKCNLESVWKVVELALECLHREGLRRPDMENILDGLAQAIDLQDLHVRARTLATPRAYATQPPSLLTSPTSSAPLAFHGSSKDSQGSQPSTSWSWGI